MSVENIHVLDKAPNDLQLLSLNESYRAYSDGQLAPAPAGSRESIGRDAPPSPSGSKCNPLSNTSLHRNQARARLSAAKLHIKSLFSTVTLYLGTLNGVSEFLSVCMIDCEC